MIKKTEIMENLLEIKNLHATIDGKEILKGINLTVKAGEVHAIMGPNGSGKSTLSNVLVGHPAYTVTEGEVIYKGKNLLELAPEERSHEGLFLSFQYPVEIPIIKRATPAMPKGQRLPNIAWRIVMSAGGEEKAGSLILLS